MKYVAKFVPSPELGIEGVLVEGDTIEAARASAELRARFWTPTPAIGELSEVGPDHPLFDVPVQQT